MKKWYSEDWTFDIEVVGYTHSDRPKGYCRNGEEIGDIYRCGYGCPVNQAGDGLCAKTMLLLFPMLEAVRSGGDLRSLGGEGHLTRTFTCPDGCVRFRLTAHKNQPADTAEQRFQ